MAQVANLRKQQDKILYYDIRGSSTQVANLRKQQDEILCYNAKSIDTISGM